MDTDRTRPSLFGVPFAVIVVTAFCVVLPFSWLGIPSGHDFEFHFNSWLEVVAHWKAGVAYPHWAALAHYGYGEARFIFYPPASWTLGAALGLIVPWKFLPPVYICIVLTLCGSTMFLSARTWLTRNDALFAAIAYVINPYHLVIVYWRSDMAELLASAYLPLLFLFTIKMCDDPRRAVAPLSIIVAAGWLTNVPVAVMMNYSFGFLALLIALSKKSWKTLLYAGVSVLLSAALAAVYLLPVLHQQHWVNIGQVLSPGVRPVDNFLFTIIADADHNQFNRLASTVTVWEIAIVVALFALSLRCRSTLLWRLAFAWAAMCILLIMRFTLPLWTHLPALRYVQFPWRWLICLGVAFAIGTTLAFRQLWARVLVCLLAFSSIVYVWHRVLPPWWDNSGDIQEMVDNQQDNIGNEGTDEYVPAGVDPYDIDQNAPQAQFVGAGKAQTRIAKWEPEKRVITADAPSSGNLVLRLFNYYLWKVRVNGRSVHTETVPHTGEMLVPVSAGTNLVEVEFAEGWDRLLGGAISAVALIAVLCFQLKPRACLVTGG